jgi:hypothetical protein
LSCVNGTFRVQAHYRQCTLYFPLQSFTYKFLLRLEHAPVPSHHSVPSLSASKTQASQPLVQTGLTGLFMASMNGHLDVVRLLLDSRADANLADQVPAPGATRPQAADQFCSRCQSFHPHSASQHHQRLSASECLIADCELPKTAEWRSGAANDGDHHGAEAGHQHGSRASAGHNHNHAAEAGLQDRRGRRRGQVLACVCLERRR